MDALWRQWWKVGGMFGVGFVILFIIGPIFLSGETPSRDDSIEDIRAYFTDDAELYLASEFIAGIAFSLFFLPYVVTLRWVLGSGEGWPPIWSWLTVIGGVLTFAFGAAASVFWGALAISASNPEVDDTAVRTLMELDTYAFTFWAFPLALFVGAASLVILRTGVLWRWLGAIGLISAVLLIISASWPIDGDEEGALAIGGFIGFPGVALFVLISSINMIMLKEEPAPTERAGSGSAVRPGSV